MPWDVDNSGSIPICIIHIRPDMDTCDDTDMGVFPILDRTQIWICGKKNLDLYPDNRNTKIISIAILRS